MPLYRGSRSGYLRQDIFHVWRFEIAIDSPGTSKGQAKYEAAVYEARVRALRAKTRQQLEKLRFRTEALKFVLEATTDLKERRELNQNLYIYEKELEGLKNEREAFEKEHGDVD